MVPITLVQASKQARRMPCAHEQYWISFLVEGELLHFCPLEQDNYKHILLFWMYLEITTKELMKIKI